MARGSRVRRDSGVGSGAERLTEAYLAQQPIARLLPAADPASSGTSARPNLPLVEAGRLFYRITPGLQLQSPLYLREGLAGRRRCSSIPTSSGRTGRRRWRRSRRRPTPATWPTRIAERRRRLADDPDPQPHHRPRISTTRSTGCASRAVVDEGRQGLLLLALSRAARRQGAGGGARGPRPLLPRARHAAGAGPPDLHQRPRTRRGSSAASLTEDGRYLLVSTSKGADNNNRLYCRGPRRSAASLTSTRSAADLRRRRCGVVAARKSRGDRCSCARDRDAPNRRIVAIDCGTRPLRPGQTVIPESPHAIEKRRCWAAACSSNTSST